MDSKAKKSFCNYLITKEKKFIERFYILFNEAALCRNSDMLVSGKTHMLYPPSS
jgi:hypothetical protein